MIKIDPFNFVSHDVFVYKNVSTTLSEPLKYCLYYNVDGESVAR
jgi:hypothetical protein